MDKDIKKMPLRAKMDNRQGPKKNIQPIRMQQVPKEASLKRTMSNKKIHLADFETYVFRVYLWNHVSYRKVINVYVLKKSAILKKSKTFFMDLRFRN